MGGEEFAEGRIITTEEKFMSVSHVLEVAVGLIVIYYILGSVVSLITQLINEFFESRGKALEQYLIRTRWQ